MRRIIMRDMQRRSSQQHFMSHRSPLNGNKEANEVESLSLQLLRYIVATRQHTKLIHGCLPALREPGHTLVPQRLDPRHEGKRQRAEDSLSLEAQVRTFPLSVVALPPPSPLPPSSLDGPPEEIRRCVEDALQNYLQAAADKGKGGAHAMGRVLCFGSSLLEPFAVKRRDSRACQAPYGSTTLGTDIERTARDLDLCAVVAHLSHFFATTAVTTCASSSSCAEQVMTSVLAKAVIVARRNSLQTATAFLSGAASALARQFGTAAPPSDSWRAAAP